MKLLRVLFCLSMLAVVVGCGGDTKPVAPKNPTPPPTTTDAPVKVEAPPGVSP
jgi:hypothetical protein